MSSRAPFSITAKLAPDTDVQNYRQRRPEALVIPVEPGEATDTINGTPTGTAEPSVIPVKPGEKRPPVPIHPSSLVQFDQYIKESLDTSPSWRSSIPVTFIATALAYAYWGNGTVAMKLIGSLQSTPLDPELEETLAFILNLSISGSNFFVPFALFPEAIKEVLAQVSHPQREIMRSGKKLTKARINRQRMGILLIALLSSVSIGALTLSNLKDFLKATLNLAEFYLFLEWGKILLNYLKQVSNKTQATTSKKSEGDIENPLERRFVHLRLTDNISYRFTPDILEKHSNQLALKVLTRLVTGMEERLDRLAYKLSRGNLSQESIIARIDDIEKKAPRLKNTTAWTKTLALLEQVKLPKTTLTKITKISELMNFQARKSSSIGENLLEKIQQQSLCLRLLALPVEIPYRLLTQVTLPLLNAFIPHRTITNLLVNLCMLDFAVAFYLPVFNVPDQLPIVPRVTLATLTAISASLLSTVLITWGNNRTEKIDALLRQLSQGVLPQIYPPEINPRSIKGVAYGTAFVSASLTLSLAFTSVSNSLMIYGLDPQNEVAKLWFIEEFDNPLLAFFLKYPQLAVPLLLVVPIAGTVVFNNLATKITSDIIFGLIDKLIIRPLQLIGAPLFSWLNNHELDYFGIKDMLTYAEKTDKSMKKIQQLRKLVAGERDLLSSMVNAQGAGAALALLTRFTDTLTHFQNNQEKSYQLLGTVAGMSQEVTERLLALQFLFAKGDENFPKAFNDDKLLAQDLLNKYGMSPSATQSTYGALSGGDAKSSSSEYSNHTFRLGNIGRDFGESEIEEEKTSTCQKITNAFFSFFFPCARRQKNPINNPVIFEHEPKLEAGASQPLL